MLDQKQSGMQGLIHRISHERALHLWSCLFGWLDCHRELDSTQTVYCRGARNRECTNFMYHWKALCNPCCSGTHNRFCIPSFNSIAPGMLCYRGIQGIGCRRVLYHNRNGCNTTRWSVSQRRNQYTNCNYDLCTDSLQGISDHYLGSFQWDHFGPCIIPRSSFHIEEIIKAKWRVKSLQWRPVSMRNRSLAYCISDLGCLHMIWA